MNNQNRTKRIERLEAKEGPKDMLEIIFFQGISPSKDGPKPSDSGFANILSGKLAGSQLVSHPDETWEEFEARVTASN